MNKKGNSQINSEDVGDLLRKELNQEVNQNLHLLEGFEQKVIDRIEKRIGVRSLTTQALKPFYLKSHKRIAIGVTALLLVVAGIFIGMAIEGIFTSPGFTDSSGPGVWFVVVYPEAKQVAVAGDFTDWEPKSLHRKGRGIWAIKLDLKPGRYEYNFVVNDRRWVLDPRADEYAKSFGEYNSVIYVGRESA